MSGAREDYASSTSFELPLEAGAIKWLFFLFVGAVHYAAVWCFFDGVVMLVEQGHGRVVYE